MRQITWFKIVFTHFTFTVSPRIYQLRSRDWMRAVNGAASWRNSSVSAGVNSARSGRASANCSRIDYGAAGRFTMFGEHVIVANRVWVAHVRRWRVGGWSSWTGVAMSTSGLPARVSKRGRRDRLGEEILQEAPRRVLPLPSPALRVSAGQRFQSSRISIFIRQPILDWCFIYSMRIRLCLITIFDQRSLIMHMNIPVIYLILF